MSKLQKLFFGFLFFLLFVGGAKVAFANVVINEIMYDLDGSDDGREWIEIFNGGGEQTDLSGWKFYENDTNHSLSLVQGGSVIQPSGYAVVVDNSEKFLADWPGFSGVIFDSSFSLKNTGESLSIRNGELNDIDQIIYNPAAGAVGDGNSLQKTVSGWIVAVPTPGIQNSNNNQSPQNNPPPDNPPSNDNQQQPATEPTGGSAWPTEEQIFANAGEDKTAVAGADLMFSGNALGIKKEPLENARHSWNFGDGASAEGQNVRHFYKYPGNYIAVLDVSSGKFSASDRLNVRVAPNELQITEANKDFIKLKNKSNVLLDVSGWFLRAPNNQIFTFPESSLIAANSDLIISSDVSKIKLNNNDTAELLYPNGSIAFIYEYKINIQPLIAASQTSSPTPPPLKGEGGERSKPGEDNSAKRPVFDNNKVENTDVKQSVSNNIAATSSEQENQLASVIAVVDKKDFWEGKWIFLAILLGVFSSIGLFFVRRYGDTSPKSESDEFDI